MADHFLIGEAMTGGYGAADILQGCTIAVEKGQIAVIVGPNGAGKSTAMKAVFGMLRLRKRQVRLGGEDITAVIRQAKVAAEVSRFAREPKVRTLQLEDARKRAESSGLSGVVVEGRDITTVVYPDAPLRVLLTASEAVRLTRRGLEQTESSENLKARDKSDSQVVDFFTPAEGVKLIDTTELNFEESVKALTDLYREVNK